MCPRTPHASWHCPRHCGSRRPCRCPSSTCRSSRVSASSSPTRSTRCRCSTSHATCRGRTQTCRTPWPCGFSLYEDMGGAEMLGLHAAMSRRGDSKCIEELQKVAIGVSENVACLLALLDTLRQQTTSPRPRAQPPAVHPLHEEVERLRARLSGLRPGTRCAKVGQ